MKTFASIFSGGELAGIGAMQAGYTPVWGVEMDAAIAKVAERNVRSKIIVSRAQDIDYSKLQRVDRLHASPVCVNASQAKQDGKETEEDISQARSIERALIALSPSDFSLENVWNYRNFESFRIVLNCLQTLNYQFNFWHLNSADFGVPQTRKRLILLASKNSRPQKPVGTHTKNPQPSLFGTMPRWIGWYEAIEDLIPTLPESKFAEWQLKKLSGLGSNTLITEQYDMPSGCDDRAPVCLPSDIPASTVLANHAGKFRAFIVPGGNESSFRPRFTDEPSQTIGDVNRVGNRPRAFIVDGKPANYAGDLQIIKADEPVVPITATQSQHPFRAWLSKGRVVSMTPRALARFQSIPDSYDLPEKNSLACRIIGNAVPPLLMQRIIESQSLNQMKEIAA